MMVGWVYEAMAASIAKPPHTHTQKKELQQREQVNFPFFSFFFFFLDEL